MTDAVAEPETEEVEDLSEYYDRVKTPTIIQMEAVECGAACLAIALAYFGKHVPLAELRIACGVSRDGSNALFVMKAAHKYGLEAHGYRKEPNDLIGMPLPMIVFWNFEHFVVVEGFDKEWVYINDPATGPRRITYDDFDQAFTGVVICLEPGPSFVKGGKPPGLIKALMRRLYGMEKVALYLFISGLCILVPTLALPAFTQVFLDDILGGGMVSWKWTFLQAMVLIGILAGLMEGLQSYVLNRLGVKFSIRFSSNFMWHILNLPMSFYSQRYGGEIANRMSLNSNISDVLTGSLAQTLLDCLLVVVYGFVMFYYDAWIATLGILAVLSNIAMVQFATRLRQDAYSRLQADSSKLQGVSIGALQNIETIKATGIETKFFSRWAGYYTKTANSIQEMGKVNVFYGTLPALFDGLVNTALLGFGIWRVINGHLTVGMLIALQMLMRYFVGPVSSLVGLSQTIQLLKVDIARLDDVLENKIDPLVTHGRQTAALEEAHSAKLQGYVEVRDLHYGYNPNAPPILNGINIQLSPGKSVALVGPSGCGKSTVTKVVAGLFTPWKGEILFDGHSRDHYPRSLINNSMSLIEQDVFVFTGTMRENLTMMDPTVSEEDMIRAAKDALIHDDIMARKGGYDCEIDEKGANLSGGQRQRLEIARSLLRNPIILVLDEATSALDSRTEHEVVKNIRRRGCACLVIAHRLSTIRNCDEIIVLDKGIIVQKGTHDELKEIPGLYRSLIESEQQEEKQSK